MFKNSTTHYLNLSTPWCDCSQAGSGKVVLGSFSSFFTYI